MQMKQPTMEEITQKTEMVLNGSMTREELCRWASEYIRNDEQICINDLNAWHYLVAVSNIDEMLEPDKYLFNKDDIQSIVSRYDQENSKGC